MPDPSVGFVGLGTMGFPMALNLHKAGLLAAVWNRSPDKAADFSDRTGCTACSDPASVAHLSEIIVLCVSGDGDVLEVIDQLAPHLADNALIIDCSTVSASTAQQAAERLSEKGARFIDCPVSGGTEGAWNGTLSLMMGGDAVDIERARPVLEAIGATISHMGPVGAGQATKATNQIMVAGINQAVSEAMAFGQAHGLQIETMIGALEGGAAANWFLSHRGPNMANGEFPLGFKVALHAKDLRICRDMAASYDVRLPIVEMTLLHYKKMLQDNDDEEDISSLFRLKSALFAEADKE
ncbi:MAG: NAD(P)-dependent oxidoreductase [Gammaproteobacteria bacterium]